MDIEIEHHRCNADRVALAFHHGDATYRAIYSFAENRLFEPASDHEPHMNVLLGNRTLSFIEFLNEFPLCFYTEDLSLLRGFDLPQAAC